MSASAYIEKMTVGSDFNQLPWHDAVLQRIEIDRRMPGERDTVFMNINWPDGSKSDLNFFDCYSLKVSMNFGVIADETIRSAAIIDNHELINSLRVQWSILTLPSDLKCYVIETNSTASTIEICARGFDIHPAQVAGAN